MKKLGESKEKWHKAGYDDGYRKGVEDAAEILFCQGYEQKDCDCLACDWQKEIMALLEKSR